MTRPKNLSGSGPIGVSESPIGQEQDATSIGEESIREIVVRFERYEIGVLLGSGNQFLGINYVSISRQFIKDQRSREPKAYHDVESLFPPEKG
jgi:hypothetical protein